MHDVIHYDVVKRFSTWRMAEIGQRRQVGTVSLAVTEPESIQAPRSLLAHGYPQVMVHESQRLA
jgi:hypothetical protein